MARSWSSPGNGGSRTASSVLAGNPFQAVRVAGLALQKARQHSASLRSGLNDLLTLIRLIRAWSSGRYHAVPWRTLIMASAAVLYFVNPLDVIPDQLPGIGYVDDVAVITMVASLIRADLERFVNWERGASRDAG